MVRDLKLMFVCRLFTFPLHVPLSSIVLDAFRTTAIATIPKTVAPAPRVPRSDGDGSGGEEGRDTDASHPYLETLVFFFISFFYYY